MSGDVWEQERRAGQDVLGEAGLVLVSRARLDGLALEVLASRGMGEAEASRMATFLDREWPEGVAALSRLTTRAAAGERPGCAE